MEAVGATALRPLLEASPVEGLTKGDLGLLGGLPPGMAADWLRRGKALFDAGYTLGALRAAMPPNDEIVINCNLGSLIRVGEIAQVRGHEPGHVDSTDWILERAKSKFPKPYHYWPAGSDELQAELASLVRRDVEAHLITLGDRGNALRTLLEQYPTEWLSVDDVSYLFETEPQKAADLLGRYESLRKDGYTNLRLRDCYPSMTRGPPSIGDIVAVGEEAKRRGLSPAQVTSSTWIAAWDHLDWSTRERFRHSPNAAVRRPNH